MSLRSDRTGVHGILAPVARLDAWLQVVMVALVATCAARYVDRHGVGAAGTAVLVGASVLAVSYATRGLLPDRSWWPTAWVGATVAIWCALTLAAPSFAWCAVPVAFAVLRVLPFGWAAGSVVLMTLVVSAGWLRVSDGLDPTLVAGPVGIALVTVIAYRALEREAQARQALVDRLLDARAELAEEQHRTGALAERTRLSREIHDSVGQGLSSINLLLQAAEQAWTERPDRAREHVRAAAATARDGLEEVRRVVRDLAPVDLAEDRSGAALGEALRHTATRALPDTAVEVHVHGDPVPVPAAVASAILTTTRGALANVREHARAARAAVTLTYLDDEVMLDVRDDGRGFDPSQVRADGLRGHGLRGIRDRATGLGGHAEVESAPGEGTTISVRFPLEDSR
jgi:signal transduction histidine kinase